MAGAGLVALVAVLIAAAWVAQVRWGGWATVPVAVVGVVLLVAYGSATELELAPWAAGALFLAAVVLKPGLRRPVLRRS